jgi:hypothetical protein
MFVCGLFLHLAVRAQQNNDSRKSSANLYEQFKAAEILPCGERAEAVRLGRLILENYQLSEHFSANLKIRLAVLKEEESLCDGKFAGKSPHELLAAFKTALKQPCGQRSDAVRLAKFLFVKHSRRELLEYKGYLETQIPILEKEEKECEAANALEILFEDFKQARKLPCGRRDEALRIGREINEKFKNDELNREVVDYVKTATAQIEGTEKQCKAETALAVLLEDFRKALKLPCGERDNVRIIGKRLIELHGADEKNLEIISFVEKEMANNELQEYTCERNSLYHQYYKSKNWNGFFKLSKDLIENGGNKQFALDVMLTLVSVGYKRAAYDRTDIYNGDTLFYAKKALDLIEDGVKTQARWGILEPFETKDKALAWLNYTVGYISYFRQMEGKKAIPYFYKAAGYKSEFKYDAFVYQAVAIHYFEKNSLTISTFAINEFITKASNLGLTEGTEDSPEEEAKNKEIAILYKQLLNLYNLRYNLEPNENVTSLTDYILKLINRPLIDTAARKDKESTQALN